MSPFLLRWQHPPDVARFITLLKENNLAIGTTDTIIGLFAPASPEGHDQLDVIKKRESKPYIVLIPSKEAVKLFAQGPFSAGVERLISACWPGPLTLIFPSKLQIENFEKFPYKTIALRVPAHEGLLVALKELGALFSTSANRADMPVPATIKEIDPALLQVVTCVITDSTISIQAEKPSTILDCTGKKVKVVREGAYAIDVLERIYGSSFVR